MHYSSDEDEAEGSSEAESYHHAKNLQHNRAYDGSRCFCKPCPQCHGVWIPADCLYGATCDICKPPWQNNLSGLSAFLARNARAHWRLVRWCVRVRPWALHWLSAYTERRYAPTELDMAHELASATAGGVWNLPSQANTARQPRMSNKVNAAVHNGSPPPLENEISDDEDDQPYVHDSESAGDDTDSDYPALSEENETPTKDGLEPWHPKDTVYNFRRHEVRLMMFKVKAFEQQRTACADFEAFWKSNRLVGFLPVSLTEGNPNDPWTITKKELQRVLRLSCSILVERQCDWLEEDVRVMKSAVAHAPRKLPKCHKVDPASDACRYPMPFGRNWNKRRRTCTVEELPDAVG